jgi:hypothetical protein
MFLSVKALGFTPAQASLAAAIPFVLGVIDVMAGTAFSITGAVFILAVLAAVFPAEFLLVKNLASNVVNQAGSALEVSSSNASVTTQPAPPAPAPMATAAPVISAPVAPAGTPNVVAPSPSLPAGTPAVISAPATPAAGQNPPVISSTTGSSAQK